MEKKKPYNLDSLRAQLKCIWKTKKKFEVQVVGRNLFLVSFEEEDRLDFVLFGQPWLFQCQLVIFDRLTNPIERQKLRLTKSPFWLKVGPCPLEYDQKDLMHAAVGSTFRGILQFEEKGEFCRIKVNLDVQKPLRRGVFVETSLEGEQWIAFKYENLSIFYFGCGRLGHGLKDCELSSPTVKESSK